MADQMAERMASIEAWKTGHDKLCTEIRDDHREDMQAVHKGLSRVHGRMDKMQWGIVILILTAAVSLALEFAK
jgi:hypothetical protein